MNWSLALLKKYLIYWLRFLEKVPWKQSWVSISLWNYFIRLLWRCWTVQFVKILSSLWVIIQGIQIKPIYQLGKHSSLGSAQTNKFSTKFVLSQKRRVILSGLTTERSLLILYTRTKGIWKFTSKFWQPGFM